MHGISPPTSSNSFRSAVPPSCSESRLPARRCSEKLQKKSGGGIKETPEWAWLDDISNRLEAARYAIGATDIPAAGVGSPNIRQRTYFGAYDLERSYDRLAYTDAHGRQQSLQQVSGEIPKRLRRDCLTGGLADSERTGLERGIPGGTDSGRENIHGYVGCGGAVGGLGNTADEPRERDARSVSGAEAPQHGARVAVDGSLPFGFEYASEGVGAGQPRPVNGFWGEVDWLSCQDGKWRPVEPGTFPLAHGIPARVVRLRGYGNAINPWTAKEFIHSFEEAVTESLGIGDRSPTGPVPGAADDRGPVVLAAEIAALLDDAPSIEDLLS